MAAALASVLYLARLAFSFTSLPLFSASWTSFTMKPSGYSIQYIQLKVNLTNSDYDWVGKFFLSTCYKLVVSNENIKGGVTSSIGLSYKQVHGHFLDYQRAFCVSGIRKGGRQARQNKPANSIPLWFRFRSCLQLPAPTSLNDRLQCGRVS